MFGCKECQGGRLAGLRSGVEWRSLGKLGDGAVLFSGLLLGDVGLGLGLCRVVWDCMGLYGIV